MIAANGTARVMVATQPVDFRRGINGLTALVAGALKTDPYCGDLFVFRSKRSDRLKILVWDGSGMILATKWLEDGRFTWPPIRDSSRCWSPVSIGRGCRSALGESPSGLRETP